MLEDPHPAKLSREAPPPSGAAARMRRYRHRRRRQRLIVRVELDPGDIDILIARKYVAEADRGNLNAIEEAANAFVADAFCEAK